MHVVERLIIGDRPVRCLSGYHLVLPLKPQNVHIGHVEQWYTWTLGTHVLADGAGWVRTRRGVQGGVRTGGVPVLLLLLLRPGSCWPSWLLLAVLSFHLFRLFSFLTSLVLELRD